MMITENYRDYEIVLLEEENKWRATINGRERTFDTLPKVRESIDRFEDEPKKVKKWEPFDAYKRDGYGRGEFVIVKVTSLAEKDYGSPQVWVSNDGKRSKEQAKYLYEASSANAAIVAEIQRLEGEISKLNSQKSEQAGKLTAITLPSE
jgi:hypothetical protein